MKEFAKILLASDDFRELLAGALMSSMGASSISFVIDPVMSFVICPSLLLGAIVATTLIITRQVGKYENYIIFE